MKLPRLNLGIQTHLLVVMLFLTVSTPLLSFVFSSYTVYQLRQEFGNWQSNPPAPIDPAEPHPPHLARPAGFEHIAERFRMNGLLASIASTVLASLLAVLFARQIARPLTGVSLAARKITEGDLSARVAEHHQLLGAEAYALVHHFNEMAVTLQELDNGRKQMVADIAHELRTPLTVLQARLDGIEDGIYTFDADETRKLGQHVAVLIRLVEDLRLLSMAHAGQLPVHLQEVHLNMLIEDVISVFESHAQQHHLEVHVLLPSSTVVIQGDPDRLAQVLNNLLDNALRHAKQHIWVALDTQGTFSVEDDGLGVAENELSRLFEAYYRTDWARSRDKGGSGLGLALVQAFMQAHGGRAYAKTSQYGGLAVICTFN